MKKFASVLLAAAAVVTSAFADGAVSGNSATGAYVGGNVGMGNTNVKYGFVTGGKATTVANNVTTVTATDMTTPNNYKSDAGKMNPLFGLFAGYGMQVGQMYFGGEVYGGFDSAKVSPYDDSATVASQSFWKATVKRTNFYGIAPRLGAFITPSTMVYVKLGIEGGKWTSTSTPSGNVTSNDNGISKRTFTSNKNSISFAPGLGLDAFITKNLFLRAEYSYLFGPKMTLNQDITYLTSAAGTTAKHTFQVTQQTFKVGVGYKF
jgi:outer membrane immunogenic protein